MKKYLTIFFLILFSISALSQQTSDGKFQNMNSLQLELGGHGLVYSLNYERVLFNGNRFKTTAQAGIAYYPAISRVRDVWLPIGINQLYSMGNHHIEVGLGIVPIYESVRDSENLPTEWSWSGMLSGRIAYRYQKPDGRFIFRAGFTPVVESGWIDSAISHHGVFSEFHPLGGVSIGYGF